MVEEVVVGEAIKAARTVAKGVEQVVRKAWSVMDAASEKKPPSQYLSDEGIRAIQGNVPGVGRN